MKDSERDADRPLLRYSVRRVGLELDQQSIPCELAALFRVPLRFTKGSAYSSSPSGWAFHPLKRRISSERRMGVSRNAHTEHLPHHSERTAYVIPSITHVIPSIAIAPHTVIPSITHVIPSITLAIPSRTCHSERKPCHSQHHLCHSERNRATPSAPLPFRAHRCHSQRSEESPPSHSVRGLGGCSHAAISSCGLLRIP